MNKIYLDVCSLCRPFDDQNYMRIRLETDSINLILSKIKEKYYTMMKSPVHIVEINAIANDLERIELLELLETYGKLENINTTQAKKRTEILIKNKFGIADAAHITYSEFYNSTFITCDDKLINKCDKHIDKIKCVNPVTFCEMEKLK